MSSNHTFKKQFGQNFLRSDKFAHKLLEPLKLTDKDIVIEIGPGDGRVTRLALSKAAKVICIEIDYQLIPGLIKKFGTDEKFALVNVDVMQLELAVILEKYTGDPKASYKLTGSLPYNISKQIIRKFLTGEHPPQAMSFIVQEEVAQDYVAQVPNASFLSNWTRLHAEVKKLQSIPANQFFPQPKVNGGILFLKPKASDDNTEKLGKLIRVGFASPRKTLRNNLQALPELENDQIDQALEKCAINPKMRPAEITLEQWLELYAQLHSAR